MFFENNGLKNAKKNVLLIKSEICEIPDFLPLPERLSISGTLWEKGEIFSGSTATARGAVYASNCTNWGSPKHSNITLTFYKEMWKFDLMDVFNKNEGKPEK